MFSHSQTCSNFSWIHAPNDNSQPPAGGAGAGAGPLGDRCPASSSPSTVPTPPPGLLQLTRSRRRGRRGDSAQHLAAGHAASGRCRVPCRTATRLRAGLLLPPGLLLLRVVRNPGEPGARDGCEGWQSGLPPPRGCGRQRPPAAASPAGSNRRRSPPVLAVHLDADGGLPSGARRGAAGTAIRPWSSSSAGCWAAAARSCRAWRRPPPARPPPAFRCPRSRRRSCPAGQRARQRAWRVATSHAQQARWGAPALSTLRWTPRRCAA